MKTIVAATDLSERSRVAIDRAAHIAAATGARLVIVHAIDDSLPVAIRARRVTEAEEILRELAATIDAPQVEMRVAVGDIFWALHRLATQAHAGLIVAGDHRRSSLRDIFRDTTVERLIRISAVPVLIARVAPAPAYRHAVIAVESEEASELIATLSAFGTAVPARATLLHAFDAWAAGLMYVAGVERERIEEYRADTAFRAFENLRPLLSEPPFPLQIEVVDAAPDAAIADFAKREGCDLVAASSHARRVVARGILGSVSSELIRHGRTDVLIVPRVVQRAGST